MYCNVVIIWLHFSCYHEIQKKWLHLENTCGFAVFLYRYQIEKEVTLLFLDLKADKSWCVAGLSINYIRALVGRGDFFLLFYAILISFENKSFIYIYKKISKF